MRDKKTIKNQKRLPEILRIPAWFFFGGLLKRLLVSRDFWGVLIYKSKKGSSTKGSKVVGVMETATNMMLCSQVLGLDDLEWGILAFWDGKDDFEGFYGIFAVFFCKQGELAFFWRVSIQLMVNCLDSWDPLMKESVT